MNDANIDIAFAGPAARSLLQEGKLDPRWVGAFFAFASHEGCGSDQFTWPPAFFRLQHFVSMYLPLRYAAWTRLSGKRNPETEGTLATVVVTVAETLWRGLAGAARVGAMPDDAGVVDLVLGARNPLRLRDGERDDWDRRYLKALGILSATWSALDAWPRREAMALHAASFYLPLGLPPTLTASLVTIESAVWDSLLGDLAADIHPDVLQLIRLWLTCATALRDEAGIPIVEWRSTQSHRLVGRTSTEFLLLGGQAL